MRRHKTEFDLGGPLCLIIYLLFIATSLYMIKRSAKTLPLPVLPLCHVLQKWRNINNRLRKEKRLVRQNLTTRIVSGVKPYINQLNSSLYPRVVYHTVLKRTGRL